MPKKSSLIKKCNYQIWNLKKRKKSFDHLMIRDQKKFENIFSSWYFSDNPMFYNYVFQARRVIVVHRFDCILFMRLKVFQEKVMRSTQEIKTILFMRVKVFQNSSLDWNSNFSCDPIQISWTLWENLGIATLFMRSKV